eukprot:COSAG05_NODE_15543_length_367_cov_0.626866_1_plen_104_part_01
MPLLPLVLLLLLGVCAGFAPAPDTVHLPQHHGSVRGVASNGSRAFLGIPYAKAPVGRLRWSAPVPADPWPGEVFDARAPGPSCMQPPRIQPRDLGHVGGLPVAL